MGSEERIGAGSGSAITRRLLALVSRAALCALLLASPGIGALVFGAYALVRAALVVAVERLSRRVGYERVAINLFEFQPQARRLCATALIGLTGVGSVLILL